MIKDILYTFFKENKIQYILYLLTLIYIPISKVGMPHLYGKLIGSIKKMNFNITIKYLFILIGTWLLIELVHTASNIMYSKILPKFVSHVRSVLLNEIIDTYQSNFKDLLVGDTITKLIKSPWVIEDLLYEIETFIFNNTLVIITSFFYLYYYNKKLGIIYLLSMILIIFLSFTFTKACTKRVLESETVFDKTHEELEDMLSNLISVYTSKKNNFEKKRMEYLNKGIYKSEQKVYKCFNYYRMIYSFVFVIIFAILNLYSIKIFFDKQIKLETLTAIIIINYSLLGSFMTIYSQTKRFIDLKGRLKILTNYIESLPKKIDDKKQINIKNKTKINIVLKNVGFYYNPNKYILKNISLNIKQNEKVALIGEIGSGKSTIGKLLIKLYDYSDGEILINNTNLKNISVVDLRNVITYVPQHPKLFNRTLISNLLYGARKGTTKKDVINIINSIKIQSVKDVFLKNLDKDVGKYGNNFSGGQRQIAWLIRSMLQESKVIILDEPTSSLDKETKKIVVEFIKEVSKNKTLILITHDNSLLKNVDRIITLDKGYVISDK